MTKDEALKLALEALSSIDIYLSDTLSGRVNPEPATYKQWLIDGIIEARNRSRSAITAIKQARALDKMAENARELGLDYEPAGGTQVSKVWWDSEKLMAKRIPFVEFYKPIQQEPSCKDCRTESPCRAKGQDLDVCSVYVPPPAAQRQWVGLTDEEVLSEAKRFALGIAFPFDGITTPEMFARAIEAKLREKNT